jgi:hypothetical protein
MKRNICSSNYASTASAIVTTSGSSALNSKPFTSLCGVVKIVTCSRLDSSTAIATVWLCLRRKSPWSAAAFETGAAFSYRDPRSCVTWFRGAHCLSQELLNNRQELVVIHGLLQESPGSSFQGSIFVLTVVAGGYDDDRNCGEVCVFL